KQAVCLYHALIKAKELIEQKGVSIVVKIKQAMKKIIAKNSFAKIDYIEFVHPVTLESIKTIKEKVVVALAVYIGKTRLIDNMVFTLLRRKPLCSEKS
ncbi:MAG: pantoate--beta-alanine ligase, partial [Planctomycetota bacterium]